jgi:hypothetical protein
LSPPLNIFEFFVKRKTGEPVKYTFITFCRIFLENTAIKIRAFDYQDKVAFAAHFNTEF